MRKKKLLAILLAMVLLVWPLSVSAATMGYSTDSGNVNGDSFGATLSVSTSSATATLVSTNEIVKISGSAYLLDQDSGNLIRNSMNASGTQCYAEVTTYGTANFPIQYAVALYYVNYIQATELYAPD